MVENIQFIKKIENMQRNKEKQQKQELGVLDSQKGTGERNFA